MATSLEFRLHPLTRVVGGSLTYRGRGVREALRRFGDITARSPRDRSCTAEARLDESLTPVLQLDPCYTGSHPDEDLHWLRSAPGFVEDDLRDHSFREQQRLSDSPYGENRHYWKGHFVRALDDDLIDELLERIVALGRPPGHFLIESLHGAPKDVDPAAAAVGFRGAAFNLSVMAVWRDADLDQEQIAWARDTAAAIEPWSNQRRRLCQLHAGRRADRASAGRVGRRQLRATPRVEEPLGPRQRAAPKPEHPAPLRDMTSDPGWPCCTPPCGRRRLRERADARGLTHYIGFLYNLGRYIVSR